LTSVLSLIRSGGFLLTIVSGGAFSLWMNKRTDLFRFDIDEVHHLYWGILLLSMAPAHVGVWPLWVIASVAVIGAVTAMDDIIQHHIQVHDPSYRSPIHRIFEHLWLIFD